MLRAIDLTKTFGDAAAVDAISLSVPAGQMVALVGRSGAGKSTLLRLINRLQEPTAGRLLWNDTEITAFTGRALRSWRAHCAMIFQQFNLVSQLDVLTNVLLGLLNRRSTALSLIKLFSERERAAALTTLDEFGLADLALQRADTLSGGQQQRVAIARALMQQANVLLADEPIASLDPSNAHAVMRTMRRLNRQEGITVICSLHDMEMSRTYCDRIVGLKDGRVVVDELTAKMTKTNVHEIFTPAGGVLRAGEPVALDVGHDAQ